MSKGDCRPPRTRWAQASVGPRGWLCRAPRSKRQLISSKGCEALKTLPSQQFAEQAATLAETQRAAITEPVGTLRADFEQHREDQKKHQRISDERVKKLEDGMGGLAQRLEALEKGGGRAHAESPAVGDRHQYTLDYGGWPRETQRKVILADLEDTFKRLEKVRVQDVRDALKEQKR